MSPTAEPAIVVTDQPLARETLARLVQAHFETMVKFVADIRRGCVAVGGELHADAEALLLDEGSSQDDVWGANYYPGRGPDGCVEFTALINIRPARGNRGMEIADPATREQVRALAFRLIGRGEPL